METGMENGLECGVVLKRFDLWLSEPDFSYLDALAPYQPLAMKCVYCPIDTRLNFHQVTKLLKDIQVQSEGQMSSVCPLTHEMIESASIDCCPISLFMWCVRSSTRSLLRLSLTARTWCWSCSLRPWPTAAARSWAFPSDAATSASTCCLRSLQLSKIHLNHTQTESLLFTML